MSTNYREYSNEDLKDMIVRLYRARYITDDEAEKFDSALFKRHHGKPFTNPDEKAEAQRENARNYYSRKKLLKLFKKLEEDNCYRLVYHYKSLENLRD